jgi:hypothetical protein
MRREIILLWAFLLVVTCACSRKSSEEKASQASAPAATAAPAAAAPAPAAAATSESAAGEKPKKKADDPKTWKRSTFLSNTSRLTVGDKEELPLRAAQLKVTVDGFRARLVVDLFYENDRDRQLEGSFQIRLPNEASPFFFAFGKTAYAADPAALAGTRTFDAAKELRVTPEHILTDRASGWSEPKAARVVPREKAAFAYTETVRQRVDPALMEWAGAGVFNARVFPLEPRKVHRIVMGYDVMLTPVGDDWELAIDVPEQAASALVDVESGDPGAEWSFNVEPSQKDGKRHYRFMDPKDHNVTLRVKKPGVTALTGEDPKTGAYFAASFAPSLPKPEAAKGNAPPAKAASAASAERAAVFLLDTSMTATPDAFNVQLKLLSAILENNRVTMKKAAVLFFNIGTTWYSEGFFDNTADNVKALLERTQKLTLEGATDLGAAFAEAANPSWYKAEGAPQRWDVFLLSDGASTWGESDLNALSAALRSGHADALYGYSTGLPGTDGAALAHLARESGGAVFSVVSEDGVGAASTAHTARPLHLVRFEVKGGDDLLLAGRPKAVFPGQRLTLVGRGTPAKGAEITLVVEQDGKERTITTKIDRAVSSPLAARAYGEVAVAAIEELEGALEPLAIAFATQFRVTGKTCSLVMLESEADYKRFGIKQEDTETRVRGTRAADAVTAAYKQVGDALGDAKLGFLAMLAKLSRLDGVKLSLPPGASAAISAMPRSAFEVRAPRLAPKHPDRDGVPGSYEELIQTRNLDYDSATAEAERRLGAFGPSDALVALSSLVEQSPGDGVLARDVGFSALAWKLPGAAYHVFRRVAAARPHEPQTYVAIAGSLSRMGLADLAIAYYEIALSGQWDGRFGEFKKIAALDYAHLIVRIQKGELSTSAADFVKERKAHVMSQLGTSAADLVVVIAWNTDATDIDLHVKEPTGEECFYGHRDTKMGGRLTQDVTQGYGPEMYVLPKAQSGDYRVFAHYFASHQNRLGARTKVIATVIEGWGREGEKVTEKTVTLADGKSDHDILTVTR